MHDGFIKVAAGSPAVAVADVCINSANIRAMIDRADSAGVHLLVLPELSLTGCTCADLFYSETLLRAVLAEIPALAAYTAGRLPVVVLGAPIMSSGKLYDCAVVMHNGRILGIVPKSNTLSACESLSLSQFTAGDHPLRPSSVCIGDSDVPFDPNLIFSCAELPEYAFGVEFASEQPLTSPQSRNLCAFGATIIAAPSASEECVGKADFRRLMVQSASARLRAGYVLANPAAGESTQDMVFSAHNIICEDGSILAENHPFATEELIISEIDVARLTADRLRTPPFSGAAANICKVTFHQEVCPTALTRAISSSPFIPDCKPAIEQRAAEILAIQSHGLKKRIEHTHARTIVVGISGGLDSCLALLVMARTMDLLGRDRKDILAISMPGFGTTHRTRSNAEILCEQLGVSFREVSIAESVRQHFRDIGHDESVRDVTYENSQARERTQLLMDIANSMGGMVIGTGDISELALGWATYNGDHMSMYGVNAGIPKTLIRHIVRYEADHSEPSLSAVLLDILDTPVSPELLPADASGQIAQRTEDLVGPYELHDFFLYYAVRFGFRPSKIYRLARYAFGDEYSSEVILKWLRTFFRRFFMQQFKRSCLPDGPKVGSVSFSPRGDWRMPSDACSALWLAEIDTLQP